ncbi:MAG TPA: response regulator [Burkholderiaceae bacterium]|nr:response regulator [Burkholderiaceae bacterium]
MDFDFGDLFTQSARQVIPLTQAKGLLFLFDYRGPVVHVDFDAQAMRRGLHRLFCAAVDVLHEGFVFFTADVAQAGSGRYELTISAACSGRTESNAEVAQVLQRLQLPILGTAAAEPGAIDKATSARGTCPATGGEMFYVSLPGEGSLFTLRISLPAQVSPEHETRVDARGAAAWLVSETPIAFSSMERRLHRLGWTTARFQSTEDAARALETLPAGARQPALLVAQEGRTLTLARLRWLWALMPASTQVVLATHLGSPTLARPLSETDIDVRVMPFSPSELRDLTRSASLGASSRVMSLDSRSAPLGGAERRKRALVVDDHPLNRLVATGMLQILGFDVDTAIDGLEAVESCRREPPDLVLMDVQMPEMDGMEATRALRQLQKAGNIPPFPIVAATAGFTDTSESDCLSAGMDGHLLKPLSVEQLGAEIRRVMATI